MKRTLPNAPAALRRILLALLFGVAGCSKEPPAVGPIVQDVQVTDREGKLVTPPLSGASNEPLDLILSYKPLLPDPAPFGERQVRPHTEWRILYEMRDAQGAVVPPRDSMFAELYRVGEMVAKEFVQKPGEPTPPPLWQSPDPLPGAAPERDDYWGHIRLPERPGEYHLTISVYPSALPYDIQLPSDLGPAIPVFEAPVTVSQAPEGASIALPNSTTLGKPDMLDELRWKNAGFKKLPR